MAAKNRIFQMTALSQEGEPLERMFAVGRFAVWAIRDEWLERDDVETVIVDDCDSDKPEERWTR